MAGIGLSPGDASGRGGSRWLAVFAVLLLLVVVAVSVRAHYSLGPTGAAAQGPGAALLASIVRVLLVVFVAVFELLVLAALVYIPWRRLRDAGKSGVRPARLRRRSLLALAAGPAALLAVEAVLFFLFVHRRTGPVPRQGVLRPGIGKSAVNQITHLASVTVAEATLVAAAIGLAFFAFLLMRHTLSRRRAMGLGAADAPDLTKGLSVALDQGLAELAVGGDPRLAVIAAYEGMERVLAGQGVARQRSETPLEYLERALAGLRSSREALVRLTRLFESARFSAQPVDQQMRAEAEGALSKLRAELLG